MLPAFLSAPPQAVLPLWLCKGMQGAAASAPRESGQGVSPGTLEEPVGRRLGSVPGTDTPPPPRDPPQTSSARPGPITGETPCIAPHPSSSNRSLAVAVVSGVNFLPARPSWAAPRLGRPVGFTLPCAQGPRLNASVRKWRPRGLEPCPLPQSLPTSSLVPDPQNPGHAGQAHVLVHPFALLLSDLLPKQHRGLSEIPNLFPAPAACKDSSPGHREQPLPSLERSRTTARRPSRPISIHPPPGALTCTEPGLLRGPLFAKLQVNPRAVSPQG